MQMNRNEFMNHPSNPKIAFPMGMSSTMPMGYMNQDMLMSSQMNQIPRYIGTQSDFNQPMMGTRGTGHDYLTTSGSMHPSIPGMHMSDQQPVNISFLTASNSSISGEHVGHHPQMMYDEKDLVYDMGKLNINEGHVDPHYHGNMQKIQGNAQYKNNDNVPDFQIQNERDFPSLTKDTYSNQQHNINTNSSGSSSTGGHDMYSQQSRYQQARFPQHHQPQTGIHPQTLQTSHMDTFDLAYLINRNRYPDGNLNVLYNGIDLSSLGMDLTSNKDLYPKFVSPYTSLEEDYKLPACYEVPNLSRPETLEHMKKFYDEVLFYIFYAMPRDRLQVLAAAELYARNWKYHKFEKKWVREIPEKKKYSINELVPYEIFEPEIWERKRIDIRRIDEENFAIA